MMTDHDSPAHFIGNPWQGVDNGRLLVCWHHKGRFWGYYGALDPGVEEWQVGTWSESDCVMWPVRRPQWEESWLLCHWAVQLCRSDREQKVEGKHMWQSVMGLRLLIHSCNHRNHCCCTTALSGTSYLCKKLYGTTLNNASVNGVICKMISKIHKCRNLKSWDHKAQQYMWAVISYIDDPDPHYCHLIMTGVSHMSSI